MKYIVTIILSIVLMGCTIKNEVDLDSYITLNKNKKQSKKIKIKEIKDKRKNDIVATVTHKDKIVVKYPLNMKPEIWYEEAFKRELKTISMYDEDSQTSLTINVKQIDATFKKYSMDKKNMQVNIELELIITSGKTTKKLALNVQQTSYKPMILDAQGFKSIINEAMRDSVSKGVNLMINKL